METRLKRFNAMTRHQQQLGQWAEQQAKRWLEQAGYQCLAQQFHSRYGEIDLIMAGQHDLVFVEVKARAYRAQSLASGTVTASKQLKMAKTALFFLQKYPEFQSYYARFDVISFDFNESFVKNSTLNFDQISHERQWIENAFTFPEELINL